MPLLDYIKKVGLSHLLEELLSVRKSGGIYPLSQVSLALIGRLLGKERISHLEDIEDEIMLKRFFGWRKIARLHNLLQRPEAVSTEGRFDWF